MDRQEFEALRSEGNRGFMDLCRLARELGSKDPCQQLINADGKSCVGDLICFLEDNPGAIQAIYDWVETNYGDEIGNDFGEDDEENSDGICNECQCAIDAAGDCNCTTDEDGNEY